MGQAKARGTYEERKAIAEARNFEARMQANEAHRLASIERRRIQAELDEAREKARAERGMAVVIDDRQYQARTRLRLMSALALAGISAQAITGGRRGGFL